MKKYIKILYDIARDDPEFREIADLIKTSYDQKDRQGMTYFLAQLISMGDIARIMIQKMFRDTEKKIKNKIDKRN